MGQVAFRMSVVQCEEDLFNNPLSDSKGENLARLLSLKQQEVCPHWLEHKTKMGVFVVDNHAP
jgi:hypothetical protein